ncbi:mRNA N(6)-methyladenine demethylase [Ranunculus cassubicifolius]
MSVLDLSLNHHSEETIGGSLTIKSRKSSFDALIKLLQFVLFQKKFKTLDLQEHTFSAPKKWMPGKGRQTIQFGCCYNYAVYAVERWEFTGNPSQ